jgi:L,D-transpeptidase YcbB
MCEFLWATSAAALTLFISTQVFGANDQVPPQSHALATQSVADNGSSLAPLGSPDEVNSEKAKESEQAKPIRSSEDLAVADQLRGLVETKLQRYVPRQQDGAGIAALYRKRDFAPIWISAGKPLPRARQAANFLQGVAADGLDPNDYPTPPFAKADPAQLAAQELALTDSIARFVRHASTGRVAFTRVSGSIYFDLKVPDLEQALERIAGSDDVAATLDSFNPQQPEYKVLKAALASARRSLDFEADVSAAAAQRTDASHKDRGAQKSKADRIDTISANMERWRWLPRNFGAAYAIVNIPDYTLKVVNLGKTVWSTRIVVGKPGKYATPLLVETMKYITFNPTWNVPPSIIRNEYLPALEKDPGALARIGLKVGRNDDGSIRIYQPPGERNALGRIRFNFRTGSWSISTIRPTKICSRRPHVRTAMAACGWRIPTNMPRCCCRSRSPKTAITLSASACSMGVTSAPSTSTTRSRFTSRTRPPSWTMPDNYRSDRISIVWTTTSPVCCTATAR